MPLGWIVGGVVLYVAAALFVCRFLHHQWRQTS